MQLFLAVIFHTMLAHLTKNSLINEKTKVKCINKLYHIFQKKKGNTAKNYLDRQT